MRRARGFFLLEIMVYTMVVLVLLGSVIGTVGLVLHGLAENKRQENVAEERTELTELLRTDLRAAHTVELLALKSPQAGTKLRVTQAGGTVVEYQFTRRTYVVSTQGQVPAPPTPPKRNAWERGQPRTQPPPPVPLPSGPVGLSVDQTVEGPPELLRAVLVHDVQKSARHWDFYAFKQLERSVPDRTNVWELQTVKPGEKVDALAGQVFLLASLEFISPQKAPVGFKIGATTRIEPLLTAAEKP